MCRRCAHQGSATARTIFAKTRTPLRSWFAAVWYVTNQRNGVSALGLQRVLGLGSYQTAWAILHRLCRAMVRPGREQLSGTVEVDETFIGGPGRGTRRKATDGMRHWKDEASKAIVAVAVEVHEPKGFGRVRSRRIHRPTESELFPFICEVIGEGSVVHTDGSPAYRWVAQSGYVHERTVITGSPTPAHVSMQASTAYRLCSSAGCSGLTRARFNRISWTTTSMSTRFASTDAHHAREACCSTACASRRSPPSR